MELANKGSHSSLSLFSFCKKNKLSSTILMQRLTTMSMAVTEMQHSSSDSFDVHKQTAIINTEKMQAKLLSRDWVLHIGANH